MSKVIECNDVSIRYITGDLKAIGLKEYVMRKITGNYKVKEFWADKHVTFTLENGDMMGIIGTNGAGKSTLLKAISGIMEPKMGKIKVKGTIAALLELASGFDGDMTVKENAYLRGAMLGYTRAFMDEMYDEIIAFSELEEFQDRPFRQLSSGMKSRLAFSICCMVDPDIIILDEVLSVGDGAFRKKSGDKMREILNSGVTGILVSHSIDQVKELCNKVLWLDHGEQITFSADVNKVCDAYSEFLITKELPASDKDIDELALAYEKRMAEEKARKDKKETKKLEKILAQGTKNTAIEAALDIIETNAPEMLDMHEVGEWRRRNNG
ncbi:MAG: ATP-binding cassette domain-containing protein [Saccharofermentans sp.]|nr:ATP-binding cassette domain-containing protein [Saccharofermentans sp.]